MFQDVRKVVLDFDNPAERQGMLVFKQVKLLFCSKLGSFGLKRWLWAIKWLCQPLVAIGGGYTGPEEKCAIAILKG